MRHLRRFFPRIYIVRGLDAKKSIMMMILDGPRVERQNTQESGRMWLDAILEEERICLTDKKKQFQNFFWRSLGLRSLVKINIQKHIFCVL